MKWFFGTVMTVIVMIQTGDTVNFCEGQDCPVCFDNMHGPHCDISCPANCNSGCDRTTGRCDLGCTNNTYGERCEKQCPLNCNQGCNQTTADCYECKPGFHGNKCKTNCSLNCEVCEQRTGQCLKSPQELYQTRTFKTDTDNFCEGQDCPVCSANMHGPHCNISCPANCNSGCERTTGKCDLGCTNNTHGERCEKQCPLNCNQGCNQTTADCYECKPGFHGNKCKTNCSLNCEVCEQRTGQCLKSPQELYQTRTFKTGPDSKEESFLQRVGMTCFFVLTPLLVVLGCFATTIIKDKNVIQKK